MEWKRQKAYEFRRGKEEAKLEAARNLFTNGVSIELISKSLGMTIEQIKELVTESFPEKA